MRFSQARPGRVFVLRLEQGEMVHEVIEAFAAEHGIRCAALVMVGAADEGSRLTAGPEDGGARPIVPLIHSLVGVHELTGVGTIFPDDEGRPSLHSHVAVGREGAAATGCIRAGVVVWTILEVVLLELEDCTARRAMDPSSGFELLEP
jgi:predicted DNA-binding protein with PD1-like motif